MALAKGLIPFEICIVLCSSFLTQLFILVFKAFQETPNLFIFVLIRCKPSDEACRREGELPSGPRGGIKVSLMA